MPETKALGRDAAARQQKIAEGRCGRCKVRDIDYDRSYAKCARCLDRAKAESEARTKGTKPVYPDDASYPPPYPASPNRPPKGEPKKKPKTKAKKGEKTGARARKV